MWEKPEQIMTIPEWKAISADGVPPGVFTPNMSYADRERWKATLKYKKTKHPQIEIRKTLRGVQLLIIVGRQGWKYHQESPEGRHVPGKPEYKIPDRYLDRTMD